MKDIIKMNQLAGVITEGQAKKMMQILNEADSDVEKLKDYIEKYSFGVKVLDIPEVAVIPFTFNGEKPESFEDLLKRMGIEYKYWPEMSNKLHLYKTSKNQIKKFLGM